MVPDFELFPFMNVLQVGDEAELFLLRLAEEVDLQNGGTISIEVFDHPT